MESRKKYRLHELEEMVSKMEFEDKCNEFLEIDESVQLLVSSWYIWIPSLLVSLRAGVACIYNEEAGMFLPEDDITILYEGEELTDMWLCYEPDGLMATLDDWLKGNMPTYNLENMECYLVMPDSEEKTEPDGFRQKERKL